MENPAKILADKIFSKAKDLIGRGFAMLKPFKDGGVIAIHKPVTGRYSSKATWRLETSGSEVGGLVGLLIQKDKGVKFGTLILSVPKLVREENGLPVETQIGLHEMALRERTRQLLSERNLTLDIAHPDNVDERVEKPARRISNGSFWKKSDGYTEPSKVKYDLLDDGFPFSYEEQQVRVSGVFTTVGTKSVVERMVERRWIPATVLPTWETNAGKLCKYLNHVGLKVGVANIHYLGADFGLQGPKSEDGLAYASMRELPSLLTRLQRTDVLDPKANTLFNKAREIIAIGLKTGAPVMLKMWTSGEYAFGKGMICFLPEAQFDARFGDLGSGLHIVGDGNFIKYVDDTKKGKRQALFLHDVHVARHEGLSAGLALFDRIAPVKLCFDLLAEMFRKNFDAVSKEIAENGISGMIRNDDALDEVARLIGQEQRYSLTDIDNVREKATKAVLERIFNIHLDGCNLYACSGAMFGVTDHEIVVHPSNPLGKKGDTILVVRYPLLNPAGVKWLTLRYSELVPLNAVCISPVHMADLAMDFDGDRLALMNINTKRNHILSKIYTEVFGTKNRTMGKALKGALTDSERKATASDAVLRAGVAQHLLGIADTALSRAICHAESIDEALKLSLGPAENVQATVDAIKKVMADFKEFEVKSLDYRWRAMRIKPDAVWASEKVIKANKGVHPVGFESLLKLAEEVISALHGWLEPVRAGKKLSPITDKNLLVGFAEKSAMLQALLSERTSASILMDGKWNRFMVAGLRALVTECVHSMYSTFSCANAWTVNMLVANTRAIAWSAASKSYDSVMKFADPSDEDAANRAADAFDRTVASVCSAACGLWGEWLRKELPHIRLKADVVAASSRKPIALLEYKPAP